MTSPTVATPSNPQVPKPASFWATIFGDDHPVEIEIGPGTGSFLLSVAAQHRHRNYFAIEHSRSHALRLEATAAARGLANVRILPADAGCIVGTLIPDAAVAAYHIYFPDPWWKRRHHRRRLFTPAFAAALARTLALAGRIHLATDVAGVFALMRATLEATGAFVELADAPSPRTTTTSFERKGIAHGASIHQTTFARNGAHRAVATAAAAADVPRHASPAIRRPY